MAHDFSALKPLLSRMALGAWDCDGTLLHNEGRALDVIREEVNRHIGENSKHPNLADKYRAGGLECCRHYAGIPLPQIRDIIGQQVGIEIPVSVEQRILERRRNSPEPGEIVRPIAPLADLVKFFNLHNIPQVVVTSSEAERAKRYIRAANLDHYFRRHGEQWLISGHDDFHPPRHKPQPDAYNLARQLHGADSQRTVAFEDSLSGVRAAVNAGIHVIGHTFADHIAEERKMDLERQMREAGTNFVVHRPEELAGVLTEVLQNMPPRPRTVTARVQQHAYS